MIFAYVASGAAKPVPSYVLTTSDLNIAVPALMDILSKLEPTATGVPTLAFQMKLEPNLDEGDQEQSFIGKFPEKNPASYFRTNGSIFHMVVGRKSTPLDRVVYIIQ